MPHTETLRDDKVIRIKSMSLPRKTFGLVENGLYIIYALR